MKVETAHLMTIKNYAADKGITASYIYKLIKENKMTCLMIDGVQFIETDKFPNLPVKNRRS